MNCQPYPCRARASALLLSTGLAGAFAPQPALAAQASGQHSEVRLVGGGRQADGRWQAGVEIRLDPGFITYWRSAGEAGVAPTFDFSRSTNLAEARVAYPAPQSIDEDGIQAYGYRHSVIFPVYILPKDAAAPVTLDLSLDYAVCSKLCLAAKAHVSATMEAGSPADVSALQGAKRAVPIMAHLGDAWPVRIDAVTRTGTTGLNVEAVSPDGTGTLFVEAPEPLYYTAGPGRAGPEGRLSFTLTGPEHPPSGPLPTAPMILTLVTPSGSIEVPVRLDAVLARP